MFAVILNPVVEFGHSLKSPYQIYFLKISGAHNLCCHLSGKGKYWGTVNGLAQNEPKNIRF
jgi:hypothetical protein